MSDRVDLDGQPKHQDRQFRQSGKRSRLQGRPYEHSRLKLHDFTDSFHFGIFSFGICAVTHRRVTWRSTC